MQVKTFAALGAGVIGSGWIARALAHGLDVIAWDPAPSAEQQLRANVANAWPALERAGLKEGASQTRLRFVPTVEECVTQADFIQESAPEREDLKLTLHERVSCPPISTPVRSTPNAASSGIRSIRCICCRSSKCSAANARRAKPSMQR
jgi:hypothetical protein